MARRKLAATAESDYSQISFDFGLGPVAPVKKLPVKVISMVPDHAFNPSKDQAAIFQAVSGGVKAIAISACPGSGKTTTLKELVPCLPADASILMLAFNTDAADQLARKIGELKKERKKKGLMTPVVDCRTLHSLGLQSLIKRYGKFGRPDSGKYRRICREYCDGIPQEIVTLVEKVRVTGSQDYWTLCHRFGLTDLYQEFDIWSQVKRLVPMILQEGEAQAQKEKIIDYTDMLWLPFKQNLSVQRYDYVCVDEAQDLSHIGQTLVLKAWNGRGTFIAVGDRHQSIYEFAGASLRSIDEIIEKTQAREMRLSTTYRCPRAVVNLAAEIYPGIEPSIHVGEGEIREISDRAVTSEAQPGDLILCRYTAPLVDMCYELLRSGKKAAVRGRDLGKPVQGVIASIQTFCKQRHVSMTIDNLPECAEFYKSEQTDILSGDVTEEEEIARMQDKIDTLICLYRAYRREYRARSIEGLREYISSFFKEDPKDKTSQIVLSTGHRAKGLEYPRVFILGYNKLLEIKARSEEVQKQEDNLRYVMVTRVLWEAGNPQSGTLFLCNSED